MILSRTKASTSTLNPSKKKTLELEDLIAQRDYTGAVAFLEFCRQRGTEVQDLDLWLAFAAFHAGDYQRAAAEYEGRLRTDPHGNLICIYLACCYFVMGKYEEAERMALKGPKSPLQIRLLFHLAHKRNDDERCRHFQSQLQDNVHDQMCLASMNYMRNQYREALDIYKRYLMANREYLALNVYVALCYHKLEYYDISQELLDVYAEEDPDSATAINLHACNQYKLHNSKAARNDLKRFLDRMSTSFMYAKELFRHNAIVFDHDESALRVFTQLADVIPEARYNLVMYHLKQDEFQRAYELMSDVEPKRPIEYILKGLVNATYGQEHRSHEHIQRAQAYFQTVGSSPSECDTIPSQQCMAACYFLQRRFYDALVYLNAIKAYFGNDDTFNFNYGQAKACEEKWAEAEEAFLRVRNEKIKNDYIYLAWLARSHIYNNRARLAWELYLKLDHSGDSCSLLHLIGNDCYKRGSFFYAARAFDILERIEPDARHWQGKQGACVGAFQQIVAGRESRDILRDLLSLLRNTNRPEGDQLIKVMRSWARAKNIAV